MAKNGLWLPKKSVRAEHTSPGSRHTLRPISSVDSNQDPMNLLIGLDVHKLVARILLSFSNTLSLYVMYTHRRNRCEKQYD